MPHDYSIRIALEPQNLPWGDLLSVVEDLLPVNFSFSRERKPEAAGEILAVDGIVAAGSDGRSISSLGLPLDQIESNESQLIQIAVQFSDDPNVPFPFRGRSILTKVSQQPSVLSLQVAERPLASCQQGLIWAYSEVKGVKHFRSAFAPPALSAQGGLQDILSGERFLEMLPLLDWLRQICGSTLPSNSSLKACFIFDDPNLHWPGYGFVDYRHIASRAEAANYHVSFATIPLDTWYTHRPTAAIFRHHQKRLSLLIHGNNHSRRELARPYTEPERIFLLRQAIQRIQRLERQSGLAVARVMVPPHGACSVEMLASLPICGFEAACISHGSLRFHNKTEAWTKSVGYRPFEVIRGCPVLPRWGLSGDVKNTVLVAAYLNQAIILRGHHQDLKGNPELLDEVSRFVNGLGSVRWLNMTDMVRANGQGSHLRRSGSLDRPDSIKGNTMRTFPIWFIRRLLTEGRDRLLAHEANKGRGERGK